MSAALRLAASPTSVPQARRFVLQLLERWALADLADTAMLLTSEVVTNAVLHARTEIELTVTRMGQAVQIQVRDGSPVAPVRRRQALEATTGRGMQLLDRLSRSWDVTTDRNGKTVCFVVDASSDPWAGYSAGSWQDSDL